MKISQMRYICLAIVLFVFTSTSFSAPMGSSCETLLEAASERKVIIEKFISSIRFLKEAAGSAELPLGSLFQIILTDESAAKARISELSTEASKDSVLKLSEFKDLLSCAKTDIEILEIHHLAEQIAILNSEKIEFLKLATPDRQQLAKKYETNRVQKSSRFDLKNHLQESNEAITKAKSQLISNENDAVNMVGNADFETILQLNGTLTQLTIDLENQQIKFIDELTSHSDGVETFFSKIVQKDINKVTSTKDEISEKYKEVANVWRKAGASLFVLFQDIDLEIELKTPEQVTFNPSNEIQKKLYNEYIERLARLKERFKKLGDDRLQFLNSLRARNFEILSQTGSLRAQLLNLCDKVNCDRERWITEQNISDLILELKLVPFKVAAGTISKLLEVKAKVSSGLDGWINLTKQFVFLMFLFLVPFVVMKSLRWFAIQLEKTRKNLLNRSMMDYRKRTSIATWISRIGPFIQSVGMLVAIFFARRIIENTDLSEISNILFYAEIYFLYRVFRTLLRIVFEVLFSTDSVDRLKVQKGKIERSTAAISRLLLVEFILFHITEDAARRAFAYNILSMGTFWVNLAAVFYISNAWKNEIVEACNIRFPKAEAYLRFLSSKKFLFLALPFSFVAIFVNDFVLWANSRLIKLDFVKRLLSDVLRRKLESVEKEEIKHGAPSADYIAAFDYYLPASPEIFVEDMDSPVKKFVLIVDGWIRGSKSDDLTIIVGNRGMGKSTCLEQIRLRICESVSTHKVAVPSRTLTSHDLYNWLSEVCGLALTSVEDFKTFDSQLSEKRVLLVDDYQNLFLGKIGGFEAYREFLEIISFRSKNIFWCIAVNSRAWDYIKGVFGQEHFYGKEMVLQPWKDFEIQNLILKRHEKTGYGRSFDKSIKAYGAGDALGQQAEAQFFRLLWGQSRGNPRSSLMYWISAISSPTERMIHVGVPSFVNSSLVASMSDQSLFILAAIARHENLTYLELCQVTGISETVIRKCLKEGFDKELIWSDEAGRVRISSRAQYVIDYFLIGKNFLYE